MGISGIGMSELLVILVIVMLLFGTKHLKTIGSDLGGAIKGFRDAMSGIEQGDEEPAKRQEVIQSPLANNSHPASETGGRDQAPRTGDGDKA